MVLRWPVVSIGALRMRPIVKRPNDFPTGLAAAPRSPTPAGLLLVSIHRLSNGGTLERNAAAQEALGPGLDSDTEDGFCAMFADPDEGRRVLALVGLGQVFQAEVLLSTQAGPRWHDVEVRRMPASEATRHEATVQLIAVDIADRRSPPPPERPEDPVGEIEATVQVRRA